jgi:hypothetical protein
MTEDSEIETAACVVRDFLGHKIGRPVGGWGRKPAGRQDRVGQRSPLLEQRHAA